RLQRLTLLPSLFPSDPSTTTELYSLSLHDALPIWLSMTEQQDNEKATHTDSGRRSPYPATGAYQVAGGRLRRVDRYQRPRSARRSEEHTSELQSRENLVCRLLLEKKKNSCYRYCAI